MTNLYYKIKWAYQRVTRGWDDTATWGLDSHFIEVVVPPLKTLCQREVCREVCVWAENKTRKEVCKKTLELIEEYERESMWDLLRKHDFRKEDESLNALALYFAENISWYWD